LNRDVRYFAIRQLSSMNFPGNLLRSGRFRYTQPLTLAFSCLLLLIGVSDVVALNKSKQLYSKLSDLNGVYRHLEHSLNELRSGIHTSNVLVRDFLLDPSFLRAENYRSQMLKIHTQADQSLDELDRSARGNKTQLQELRKQVDGYWQSLDPVFEWTPEEKRTMSYIFLRRQVMPRRDHVLYLTHQIEQFSEAGMAREQRDIEENEREFKTFEKRALAISLILGLGVAALSLFGVRSLEKREAEQRKHTLDERRRAEQAEQEMRRLSQQLVRTQEEERRRISRELHDEVGQMLTALRMELRALHRLHDAPKARFETRMEESKLLLERTVQAVRDLAMGLRPAMLDDLGLVPALEWQAREFERRHDISVSMTLDQSFDSLPDTYRTALFRIVQEALTNCAKHSNANAIEISLQNQQDLVHLKIVDDGVGLQNPLGRSAGLGLLGIQERIRELGGWFSATTRASGGTELIAEIPLEVPVIGHA
jgi:signal transduction histidine kinase